VRSAGDLSRFLEVLEVRAVMAGDASIPLFPAADVGAQMPDFQLVDDNVNSPLFGDTISPRQYLEQVSGWYFIHTT
jgi:hypothetical protein